ncbi:MAG: hypothetical protein JRN68_07710 [Nitrososphaerota archaeon]|jgi:hypothetical protein|nr:hypothetical protein [Nitrososphaerota archaeon]
MVKMRLIAGAIKTIDVPFGNLIVNRAKIETTDYKSLYKVLDNLSLEGLVDAYPTGEDLFFKAAGNGTQELVNNQYSGKYSIELTGEITRPDSVTQARVFYSAFRRFLRGRGFSTTKRAVRRRAGPILENKNTNSLLLGRRADNIIQQGFRYQLEIRPDGSALLWVDPSISIFNTFQKKYLSRTQILAANLSDAEKQYGVLEPNKRFEQTKAILKLLENDGQLSIVLADGTPIIFGHDLVEIEGP